MQGMGWRPGDFLPVRVRRAVDRARQQNSATETEITTPDGLTYSFFAVQPSGEAYINLYGIDITRLKLAESELRKINAELEDKVRERTAELEEKNRELTSFTHIASHDLREPLRKIRTFGSMLISKAGDSLDGGQMDHIKRMQNAAERMQKLIDSLLAYSRVGKTGDNRKETNLNKSVEIALSNLESTINEKKARIVVGDLPSIPANRIQMIQLFQNLIGNALKYHKKGEVPEVKVYQRPVQPENKDLYEICVEDNGIGIDEQYVDQIFIPFQRLHGNSTYEGVGMGLAICTKIMDAHGGQISAKSRIDQGTTFTISLPSEKNPKSG